MLLEAILPRIRTAELMDRPDFPPALRAGEVAFLHALHRVMAVHEVALDAVEAALRVSPAPRIVDLCAGAGGPSIALVEALCARGTDVELVLTDLHPQVVPARPGVTYWPEPVDATKVPEALRGVRTQFLALHHFPPELLLAILDDAVRAGCPFVGLEGTSRSLGMTALNAVGIAPLVALLSPLAKIPPRDVPAVAAAVTVDGVLSCLRSYSTAELDGMVRKVLPKGWQGAIRVSRHWGVVMRLMTLVPPSGA